MRSLRYLNGRTPSPFPAEAEQEWTSWVRVASITLQQPHVKNETTDFLYRGNDPPSGGTFCACPLGETSLGRSFAVELPFGAT